MADGSDNDKSKWHVGKEIPLALILAMAGQVIYFAYWGGTVSNRIEQLERQMITMAPQTERVIRVETKVDALTAALTEIKQLLARPVREHQ